MSNPEEVREQFLTEVEERGLGQQRNFALQRADDLAAIRRVAATIDERNRRALREFGESVRAVGESARAAGESALVLADEMKKAGE